MTLILSKLKPYILHYYEIVVSFWENKQSRPRYRIGKFYHLFNQWKVPAILLSYNKIKSATWKEKKN